ncbi:hypothetical protein QQF64_006688 [Cirrhinus molitorella]|uniref:Reverse transcriptase n=1 Tax=Cirrhinus molitorella TaxID=172907 RepID=A0ABR3MCL5_9TELE
MDQGMVETIWQWPLPQAVKDLQWFLGFANFYRPFIKNFNLLTVPLTSMLCHKSKSLFCSPEAHESLTKLKEAFSRALILRLPHPNHLSRGCIVSVPQ